MSRTEQVRESICPLCGGSGRSQSQLTLADIDPGIQRPAQYRAVICRDCAMAMVMRTEALLARAS